MNITVLSDVHVANPNDKNYQLLLSFLDHPHVRSSSNIFFLGDIFDLMIGNHQQYLEKYSAYFQKLAQLINHNTKIHYVEGNHDFHLTALYKREFKNQNCLVHPGNFATTFWGKKFLFSHGDTLGTHNPSYTTYLKFIKSYPIKFIANHIAPYSFIDYVGTKASKSSRQHNSAKYQGPEVSTELRQIFRDSALQLNNYDFVICGHTHILDHFIADNGSQYLNNGYFPITKKFISINEKKATFLSLP